MKQIIDTITRYKTKSADPIRDQQIAYIPRIETDQIDYTIPYYNLEGSRVPVNITNQLFIKLKYLKLRNMTVRKAMQYRSGVFGMETLINNKVIIPFMLFIDGYFIPWEYMSIVIDSDNYHIIIDGGKDEHYRNLCIKYSCIQIVTLPEYVMCIKGYTGNIHNVMFSFNTNGKYDVENPVYSFVTSTLEYRIGFNYWNTNTSVSAFPLLNQTDIKITEDNIMLFVNGLFSSGIRNNVKRGIENEVKTDDGKLRFCIEFTESDDIITNPSIRLDSTLLTINDGSNPNSDVYDFALFVNPDYTESIDNISRADLTGLATIVNESNASGETPEYLNKLRVPFEMAMDRKMYYNDNVVQSINTIMKYNTSLFNEAIKASSNLIIEEYNGEWVHSNLHYDGNLVLPTCHGNTLDECVVMLVNGEVYKYSYACEYYANKLSMPIRDIVYTDSIELMRFKNINNNQFNIRIYESDGFMNYSDEVINEDMRLFCTEYNGEAYEYPKDGLQHFEIEYTLEKDSDGKIKIVLVDPYYYGKKLTLAYKNRFKHYTFTISQDSEYDEFVVDLTDKFMYCPDYSKYMIFLNGRRLLSNHYRLVLPVRPTTPFSDFKIYLTTHMTAGDKLDVIYTPILMQDIVINEVLDTTGDIVVDKSILDYGLSTDLYMIWINGKKIPTSHIFDIDSSHMRVITDEETTDTVCITKYIPSIDILNEAFDNNESIWDSITASMTTEDINTLLGINSLELTNTEDNIYKNAADVKSIMHELIRDQFLCNPRVDVTGAFVYDYMDIDTSVISGDKDTGDNNILYTADANKEESLASVDRECP